MKRLLLKFLISLLIAECIIFLISYLYVCFQITDEVMYLSKTVTDNLKEILNMGTGNKFGKMRFDFMFSIKSQIGAFCLALVLFLYLFSSKTKRASATKSKETTYGTSQIADNKEIKELKKDSGGYLLGKHKSSFVFQPIKPNMNKNVLVNAPAGSGKTTTFVIPNIKYMADRGESFVSTDTKGDTYNATSEYLKEKGYKVHVINLIDKRRSDAINPFDFIETITDAQNFVDSFLKSTGQSSADESYWDRAESLYMSTLVLYVVNHFEKQYRNIPNWINLYLEIGDDIKKRNALFDNIEDEKDKAKRSYNLYRVNTSSKVESSILLGISSRMQYFLDEDTEMLLSTSDFTYKQIVNEKTALFIITQERDVISNIVSSVIMTQTIDKLIAYADSLPALKFNKRVHLMMDEFANIAKLKSFASTLTTIRAKNIILSAIVQDLNQIRVKYKDDYNTILSGFDTKILMGATENTTKEYFVKLGGKYTADILSDSENEDKQSISRRIGEISAINESSISELDKNDKKPQSMIFIRGYNLMILDRVYFFRNSEFKNVLKPSYWHDMPIKSREVEYKTLDLEDNNSKMEFDEISNKDILGIEYEDEPPIHDEDENNNNFRGFGKW